MSFTLGVYELFSYILPGLIYLYTINEFIKLFGFQHIKYSDISGAISLFGIGIAAYLLGFLFHQLLAKFWFEDHGQAEKRIKEYTKSTREKYSLEFTYEDINFLYSVLIQRTGDSIRNHVDRLSAYNLMLRNFVGNSILLVALQISIMILHGFKLENLILIIFFILLGLFVYTRQEDIIFHCDKFIIYHAYAYGNNLESFLSNDQPKWDFAKSKPER